MHSFITVSLILHIAAGFIALLTGFISMLNRKGGKPHRLTGKIFFAAMTGVFVSATVVSIAKGLAFLFMVGFFSYYLACSGYRILFLKKLSRGQKARLLDWLISGIGILAGIGLMVFSIGWFRDRGPWGTVPLAFGSFCLISGVQDIKSFLVPPADKQYWVKRHALRMGGSFGATLTAFTVVNFDIGSLTWMLWILPGVLTGVWISRLTRNFLARR